MALTVANLNSVLATEANRLGPDIYRKTLNTSVWQKLITQEAWPDEMGEVISILTYQRSLPNAKLNWEPIKASAIGSDPQTPAAQTLAFAQKLRQYNLQQTAIESPMFDVTGLRFSFKRKEQLTNLSNIMQDAVRYSWDLRKRDEYIRLSERKIVVTTNLPESNVVPPAVGVNDVGYIDNMAAFTQTPATSELTQSVLTRIRQQLIRSGAGVNPLGRENAAPVLGLICSSETSERLIIANSDVRQDFRFADPSELVKPLGVERSFKGYYHLIDDSMPRADIINGVYVERPFWIKGADGVWAYNSLYDNAAFEISVVFIPDVYTTLMPAPQTDPGGNTKFDAVSFRGDFRFLNVQNVDPASAYYNPDGTRGFFRGILASGSKPIRPDYGVILIHQRPMQEIELIDATSSTYPLPEVMAAGGAEPTITSALTAAGTHNVVFAGYTITASNAPTSFDATGLPAGLTVNGATGVISGTPTAAGVSNVTLLATDIEEHTATATLVLTIA